ncbi:MAG TPA: class I SAM-dependent methyltransferase [Thermoanaerobaculia bacterium]|nr:class I SAM-dependent methyltransferase [Thermoanaerobaculia bacterium]
MTESAGQPAYFAGMDATGSKAADSALQILETTRPFRSAADSDLAVLDIGCGYGYTAVALARRCRSVVAIEPSRDLYNLARSVVADSVLLNIDLRPAGIEDIKERAAFDLVILDNVLEHIADQAGALKIIADSMRPAGVLYLLVPNKLWPLEAHYGLPFLSYLPLSWANRYLRLTRRGTDYRDAGYAPTYGRLIRLLRDAGLDAHFVVPADLSLTVEGSALHYRIGAAVLRRAPWLWRFAKGFLVIATKCHR